ncbi:MAG TPA: UDP-N-acetylmuramoyl-L-alanine--D-glutamate ligase [Candidatus Paceibacterota bacterium]
MPNWKGYFKGKKVTVMGLGLLGRGLGDTVFLAEQGADLIVTDLKNEKELAPSLSKLKKFKNIHYVLGRHRLEDFRNRDFILKGAGVPLDSPFVAEARKHRVPIEMSASLFSRFSPATIVGVTGTRGKSTVAHLLYHILRTAKKSVHLGGNVQGVSTLALLSKVKKGEMVVLELDSWQLQGFGDAKLSPHTAIFTNFLSDHMNYYRGDTQAYFADKANIFRFQKKGDLLIAGKAVIPAIKKTKPKGKLITPPARLPQGWKTSLLGKHNVENISLAIAAARALRIPDSLTKKAVASFKGVPGRLEMLREIRGIKIYNDTTATTPDATIAALRALGKKKNVILIVGGADKKLAMGKLTAALPRSCKAVLLLKGTGTDKIKKAVKAVGEFDALPDAFAKAMSLAQKGDIVLFSPAFASFGMFQNEFDRGEQFVRLVKRLK